MANPQGNKNYTRIANGILEALASAKLSSYEFRIIIAILRKTYGFQKKKDWISLSQFSAVTGIKLSHISRTIKKLKEKNMILKNGKITGIQKDYERWNLPKQVNEFTQTGKKKLPKQGYTKEKKETIQNKYIYSREDIKTIISYLNEKTEKNFKDTTKKTQELIRARLSEGFTLDDFKKVIDIKAIQWRLDPKMNLYLRPETLFGLKFEGYLNEKTTGIINGGFKKHFANERYYSDEDRKAIEKKFYS